MSRAIGAQPLIKALRSEQPVFIYNPGQILDTDYPEDVFKFLGYLIVPDPDHQSSLDYLKGV